MYKVMKTDKAVLKRSLLGALYIKKSQALIHLSATIH